MALDVMLAVLFAALLHAAWNALVKASNDKVSDSMRVVVGAAALAGLALPFLPAPAPASWLPIAASTLLHVLYFLLVAAAYRSGDMSIAYPAMRGAPPLLIAGAAAPLLSETLTMAGWAAVTLLVAGIALLTGDGVRARSVSRRGGALIAANVAVIVIYTLVDGYGARVSGSAASYVSWMFFFTGTLMLAWMLLAPGAGAKPLFTGRWLLLMAGSACTLGAYGIVLWAMTRAPIALVAALRETSILFGALLAATVLHEPFSRRRWSAVAMIAGGAIAIRAA